MSKIKTSGNGTKKDAIVKKAAFLFRTKGFASSSMRALAELMGVEASSLYNHIGSKNELLQQICFGVAENFNCRLQEIDREAFSALEKMEVLIRFHVRMMLETFDELYVANHEWKQLKEPNLSTFLNQRRQYENQLTAIIKVGIDENLFQKTNPKIAVLILLAAVRGLEFWHAQTNKENLPELEELIVNQLINGLKK